MMIFLHWIQIQCLKLDNNSSLSPSTVNFFDGPVSLLSLLLMLLLLSFFRVFFLEYEELISSSNFSLIVSIFIFFGSFLYNIVTFCTCDRTVLLSSLFLCKNFHYLRILRLFQLQNTNQSNLWTISTIAPLTYIVVLYSA